MTAPDTQDVAAIAAGLSDQQRRVMLHDRFNPKGWEPGNPHGSLCVNLVSKGLFRRADGRCGFEAFKDSFIVPTDLGLAVRAHILGETK